ncbi:MAG: hypothetical protein JWP89_2683 [Schlesneria sp.]|nr:hypothetical protein [Schlesneria sp.]
MRHAGSKVVDITNPYLRHPLPPGVGPLQIDVRGLNIVVPVVRRCPPAAKRRSDLAMNGRRIDGDMLNPVAVHIDVARAADSSQIKSSLRFIRYG